MSSRLVRAATALAAAGAVLTIVLAVFDRPAPAAGPGAPVATSFGGITVTRAEIGFVPSTQGPPTMARMLGRTGTGQLRVFVRLSHPGSGPQVRFAPEQFRLGGADVPPRPPDGSNLSRSPLPIGAEVDAQLWFDLPDGEDATSGRWLEYAGSDGETVRIPLGEVAEESQHGDKEHGHEH